MRILTPDEALTLLRTHLPGVPTDFGCPPGAPNAARLAGSVEQLTLKHKLALGRRCVAWLSSAGVDRLIVWIREAFIWRARIDLYNLWRTVESPAEGDGLALTPEGPWPAHVFTSGEMDSAAMLIAIAMYEGLGITAAMLDTGATATLNIDHDGHVFVRSASMNEAEVLESLAPIREMLDQAKERGR
jgi:hypothetical protein